MTAWLLVLLASTPGDAAAKDAAHGHLAKEAIRRVVAMRNADMRKCFEETLEKHPTANGKIAVTFTIETNGKVKEALVKEDSLGVAAMQACVLDVVKGMVFPAPEGGRVVVTYPFVFTDAK